MDWCNSELKGNTLSYGFHSRTPARVFPPSPLAWVLTQLSSRLVWSLTQIPVRDPAQVGHGSPRLQLTGGHWMESSAAGCWMEKLKTEAPHWLSAFTMEFGRVGSRYQRTLLITMMMFKLGKICALKYERMTQCIKLLAGFKDMFHFHLHHPL